MKHQVLVDSPVKFYQICIDEISDLLTSVFNDGIQVLSLIFRKEDASDISNWRYITLNNVDYEMMAKIILNRLTLVLDKIIEKEQTCAVVRLMCISNSKGDVFGLDQKNKKKNYFISGEYLWEVLKAYCFNQGFNRYH